MARNTSRTLALLAAVTLSSATIAAPDKLDRKQQEAVQRATSHTSEVAKALPEIQELQKFLETTEDVAKVPQQSVKDLECAVGSVT